MIWLFKCISGVRSSALASGGAFSSDLLWRKHRPAIRQHQRGKPRPQPGDHALLPSTRPASLCCRPICCRRRSSQPAADQWRRNDDQERGRGLDGEVMLRLLLCYYQKHSRKPTESVSKLTKNAILGETFYSRVCGTLDSNTKAFSDLLRCVGRSVGGLFNRVLDVTLLIRLDALNKWIEFVRTESIPPWFARIRCVSDQVRGHWCSSTFISHTTVYRRAWASFCVSLAASRVFIMSTSAAFNRLCCFDWRGLLSSLAVWYYTAFISVLQVPSLWVSAERKPKIHPCPSEKHIPGVKRNIGENRVYFVRSSSGGNQRFLFLFYFLDFILLINFKIMNSF